MLTYAAMSRPGAIFAIVLAAFLSFPAPAGRLAAAAAGAEPATYRVVAGPYARRKPSGAPAPAVSRFTMKGLTISVEYLEPEARGAFIRSLDSRGGDLFAVPPGRPEAYSAFRVAFENDSPVDVVFQPGNTLLITDHKDQRFPIDLTDLYRRAAQSERIDPEATMERAARLIFDSSTTVPRGARLARLLVFGPLPEKWREFRVHFSFLQVGTETHTVSFLFHRQPVKG